MEKTTTSMMSRELSKLMLKTKEAIEKGEGIAVFFDNGNVWYTEKNNQWVHYDAVHRMINDIHSGCIKNIPIGNIVTASIPVENEMKRRGILA